MTKKHSTKRALLASVLSLLLCVSMLIGTTFAWFTDSVTSNGNKIVSGSLNIDMSVKENGTYKSVKENSDAIFDYTLWEPGYTVWKNIKVSTTGNLALKYAMNIVIRGERSILADVIDVYYAASEIDKPADRSLTGLTRLGTISEVLNGATGALISDTLNPAEGNVADYATIVLKMQESANNDYQGKTIGEFDINLVATQYTYEEDSFDEKYDEDAKYPTITTAEKQENSALTLSEGVFAVTVPAEANNGNYTMEIANDIISTDAEGKTTLSFDLSLLKDGTDVADGSANYTVNINVGAGKIIDAVTHNGNPVTNYTYNQTTGIVTIITDSFSPFAVKFRPDPAFGKAAMVGDTYYETFAEAISNAEEGDTVAIVNDIDTLDVTISKAITLDIGGNTINEAYIKTSANVTIKNGSIKNVDESYPIVVNSGTLTVENVDIEASKSDRAIWLRNSGAVLNFNSGSILATKGENNTKSAIYGVWVSQGTTANINGGTIEVDAGANADAVGIFGNYTNTVKVTGGKISTSGDNYSYGIYTYGDVTVEGGEIVTNEKCYCYTNGITHGYNYAIYAKGSVTISGGKITTNGFSGYLVSAGGSNQKVTISNVEFANVLTDIDKTTGGHKAPRLINGNSVNAEITGGTFKGVSAALTNGSATVSGGTFDVAINESYLADGYALTDNGDGTWTVAK